MERPSSDLVVSVLSAIIREALSRGDAIDLPGLGVLSIGHRNSEIEAQPGGDLVLQPPRDEVVFTPHR